VSEARGGPDPVGLACAAATALTWGLVGPLVRAIPALTPVELVAGRLAFGLAALLPALAARRARADLAEAARAPAAWALAALLGAYYLLAVAAFRLAPVADVALLLATAPLCALALRRLGGAPAAARERGGALVALAGVALTLVPSLRAAGRGRRGAGGAVAGGAGRLLGDLLALLAAAASAGYALIFAAARARAARGGGGARPRAAPGPLGVALLTFALGTAVLALRAAAAGAPLWRASRLDGRGWALLAVLGVVSTGVPTLAFAAAARRLPPVLTSAAQLLVPVVAAAAAAATLGERPSPWLLPGGALVAAGLLRMLGRPAAAAAPGPAPRAA
jgi:drug/metabolite transporter (DMT)-like permease